MEYTNICLLFIHPIPKTCRLLLLKIKLVRKYRSTLYNKLYKSFINIKKTKQKIPTFIVYYNVKTGRPIINKTEPADKHD